MTVELFRAPLDLDDVLLKAFTANLSTEELTRARALQSRRARDRMIADHGWRRRLLADRLGCAPSEVAYTAGEHGKPRIAASGPGPRPRFSASRSDAVVWYAVSDEAEVGIDVERIDRERRLEPLARRLLSARERALYEALPETGRADALYACWTCKEAAVKALGSGLVFPLTAVEAWSGDGAPLRAHGLEIRGLATGDAPRAAALAVVVGEDRRTAVAPVVDLQAP